MMVDMMVIEAMVTKAEATKAIAIMVGVMAIVVDTTDIVKLKLA
jgi:hypothetical protein